MNDKFAFLQAPRFWSMLILSIATVLGDEGYISANIVQGIQMFLGGFVGVRTIDRSIELLSESKKTLQEAYEEV